MAGTLRASGHVPPSDKAAALGLLGLYAPDEWGGQGLSLGDGIRVYEELGKGDGAYAFALSMHNICTSPSAASAAMR